MGTIVRQAAFPEIGFGSDNTLIVAPPRNLNGTLGGLEVAGQRLALITEPLKWMGGLQPAITSATTLNISAGFCISFDGDYVIYNPSAKAMNIATSGLNGLDTGTATLGTDYFVYALYNPSTRQSGFVFSASISYTNVVAPSGYTAMRKLPISYRYGADGVGIAGMFQLGWPTPTYYYTSSDDSETWRALDEGSSSTYANVDLTAWIPENCRMAVINCVVTNNGGGGAGDAFIRTIASQPTGILVGHVESATDKDAALHTLQTTSGRLMQYKVTGDALLSIFVRGYGISELIA